MESKYDFETVCGLWYERNDQGQLIKDDSGTPKLKGKAKDGSRYILQRNKFKKDGDKKPDFNIVKMIPKAGFQQVASEPELDAPF